MGYKTFQHSSLYFFSHHDIIGSRKNETLNNNVHLIFVQPFILRLFIIISSPHIFLMKQSLISNAATVILIQHHLTPNICLTHKKCGSKTVPSKYQRANKTISIFSYSKEALQLSYKNKQKKTLLNYNMNTNETQFKRIISISNNVGIQQNHQK